MKDKEVLLKLNNLKNIVPDKRWKDSSREDLYSQICNSTASLYKKEEAVVEDGFFIMWPQKMVRVVSQPAFAVFLVVVLIAGGGLASAKIAQRSTPGNSLYIARIISEKTQLAITFNNTQKTKLNIKFANDRAKDIAQALKESEFNSDKEKIQKENLVKNFKREINNVKIELQGASAGKAGAGASNDEVQVFGANVGKDDKGMQISAPAQEPAEAVESGDETEANQADEAEPKDEALEDSGEELLSDLESVQQKLEEAEKLFDENDYDATLNKLEEVGVIIESTGEFDAPEDGEGEVKGSFEKATSTGQ